MLPCLIFEDDHLLVVNKPAGLNTHSPAPYASEGLYEWLRHREPRWADLAILHRLDKETSGLIVFGKTTQANRSLTAQFSNRSVKKRYLLLTDRPVPRTALAVRSSLVRAGEKYLSRAVSATGVVAETRFLPLIKNEPRSRRSKEADLSCLNDRPPAYVGGYQPAELHLMQAEPLTGRTHQIRVHAADKGFPVLGDTLYGGTPAARVCLHASELILQHPTTGEAMIFHVPIDFSEDPRLALRSALIEPDATNAYRLIHGAADGWPGWYVDRLGDFLLSQGERVPSTAQQATLRRPGFPVQAVYHKTLVRQPRRATQASPKRLLGTDAPERFPVRENGVEFELGFGEGYSAGLFLDQRDNRRKLLTGYIAPRFSFQPQGAELLNTFAYTCGFSICAAIARMHTTSLDLSRKYLEWGRRNFALNQLSSEGHDFVFGDAFDWLKRFAKKQRRFDIVLLDPPTFSQSKESGVFRAEKDFGRLVGAALGVLKPAGILFASSNAAGWPPDQFLAAMGKAIRNQRRTILQQHYQPQPPDFPITRSEPAYLKTAWFRVE